MLQKNIYISIILSWLDGWKNQSLYNKLHKFKSYIIFKKEKKKKYIYIYIIWYAFKLMLKWQISIVLKYGLIDQTGELMTQPRLIQVFI